MPARLLSITLALVATTLSALGAEGVKVPLTRSGGLLVADARVNGQGPYRFLIDTGASGGGRIDDDLASELGLEIVGTATNRDGAGGASETPIAAATIGLAPGHEVVAELLVADYGWIRGENGKGAIVGIVGFGALRRQTFAIDFRAPSLVLGLGPLEEARDGVFPIEIAGGCPAFPLEIGSQSGFGLFDTGSDSALSMPAAFEELLELAGPAEQVGEARTSMSRFPVRSATLRDEVRVGPVGFEGVTARFAEAWSFPLLGSPLFEGRTVTIDPRRRLARIHESNAGDQDD